MASSADASYDLAITYDDPRSDNRATVTNSHVASTFGYDDGGRLTSRTDTIWPGGSQPSRTFVTGYVPNAYDNVERITYPTKRSVIYQYDSLQRVVSLGDGTTSYAAGIRYHPSGQLSGYSSGNGVVSAYTYEPLTYRASTVAHTKGAQDLLSLTYAYSDEGNVKSIDDSRTGMSQDFTNGYDRLDRLVSGTGPWGSVGYGYDAVGNRILETRDGTSTSYHYDAITGGPSNVLTSLSGGRSEGFTPNAIGQTAADGRGSYLYTPTGLMSRAAMFSGVTATYAYDGDDQRVFAVKSGVNHYYVRGADGQVLSEFQEGGGEFLWVVDYVYLGARPLTAVRPGTGALTLTVTKNGGGSGTVTGSAAGIDCGTSCQAAYAMGAVITLTATPGGSDTRFAGWSGTGACAAESTENPRLVLLTAETTCTARFARVYPLTITKTGPGVASVLITSNPFGIICAGTCATTTATYDEDTTVTLTRTDTPLGSEFLGWSGNGCVQGPGPNEMQVVMTGDRSCTATYRLVSYKVGPANGADWLASSVTTSWSASPDSGYSVCVDQTDNNTCDTTWWPTGGLPSKLYENLPPGTYYWQAKVMTPTGTYELDEGVWWRFTVGAPGGAGFGKSAPTNGSTLGGSSVTLAWQALTGAPGYEVCWDTVNDGVCNGTWQATGAGTSYTVSGLTPGAYYWQVRAGGTVLADGGVWWTFVVPLEFHKQAPALGTSWLTSNVTVSWTAIANSGYWVCVDQVNNNTCDTMWWPTGAATSKIYQNLAPGTYYWQARVQPPTGPLTEADGGVWWTFTVGAPPGTAFSKLGPLSGASVNNSSITFGWTAVSGAPGYEVCWDTAVNGQCDGTWYSAGTATTLTVPGFTPASYEWQVRAGGTTLADGGTWWTFTVPVLRNKTYPANGATGLGSVVIATWTALPNNGYYVCWDTIDNDQCDTMWWPTGGETLRWMGDLAPGTYYWQVRDVAAGIQYDDGVWFHFTVGGGMSPMRGGAVGATEELALAPGCAVDAALVWCTRRGEFASGYYRFTLPAADGLQVWFDGQAQTLTRVPAKSPKLSATATFGVDLPPGSHVIQYEYAGSWVTAVTVTWQVTNPPSASSGGGQGSPLLVVAPAFGFEYYHQDALGSTRVVTDETGTVLRRHDFLPFGEEWPQPSDTDRFMFTGHERDSEAGLDYLGARYYRTDLGRFTTSDPLGANILRLVNPQRFNAYAYSLNGPNAFLDPDGKDAIYVNFSRGATHAGITLGHAGVAAVGADGTVTFSDFTHPNGLRLVDQGVAISTTLNTKIQFGADGLPTPASLASVAQELEALEAYPAGTVRLAYFVTSPAETAALSSWIGNTLEAWNNTKWSAWGQNCGHYARAAMQVGIGVRAEMRRISIPNIDYLFYAMMASAKFEPPQNLKPNVTTEISDVRVMRQRQ